MQSGQAEQSQPRIQAARIAFGLEQAAPGTAAAEVPAWRSCRAAGVERLLCEHGVVDAGCLEAAMQALAADLLPAGRHAEYLR